MTFQLNIANPINYIITIYPFADSARAHNIVSLTTSISLIQNVINYQLESFTFSNDIFSPIQQGSARVIQNQYETIDFFANVKEGDLLFISENGTNIFSGYVESLQLNIDSNGTTIIVNFCNLLKQISISRMFANILNVIQTGANIKMGTLLKLINENTLIQPSSAITNTSSFTFLAGDNEAANIQLNQNNNIYVTITAYMTILQAINKILYPYQRYIYQDSLGSITIAPLSLYNDLSWQFDQNNPGNIVNNLNPLNPQLISFFPYTSLNIKKNAGNSFNYAYATLFSIPIALDVKSQQNLLKNGFYCSFTPSFEYFERLNQLYNSGNFTITDTNIEDLISDPNKIDITLNNVSEILQGKNVASSAGATIAVVNQTDPLQQPLFSSQGGPDISAILFNYCARSMAEDLVSETEISITCPRVSQVDNNGNLLPLPINKIVNLSMDDGILDTSALFCRGYNLSYSQAGAVVTLNLSKPLSGGAYWVNGRLINVGSA